MARRKKAKRSRTTLRVTPAGWVFLLVSMLVGLAAVRSQMPAMFLVFGAMLAGLAVSSAIARRMVIAANVQRELPHRAWQGEALYFGYFLRNCRRRAPCLGLFLRELRPCDVDDASGYCVYLPGWSMFRAGSRLSAQRRGKVELRGVRLATKFPFGLVVAQKNIEQPTSLVVWPAKGRIRTDLLRHGAVESSVAPPGRQQGGQDEFFGLREYRIGDNPRWIHWRRSAGRDVPVVREMAHPVPDILFLVLDVQLDEAEILAEWQRERILRFSATLIDLALHRGFQVGLALAGPDGPRILSPAGGLGARCDLLDALAEVRDPIATGIDAVTDAIPPAAVRSAQVMLLSEAKETIDRGRIIRLTRSARHLSVLGPTELDELFVDHPLLRREVSSCP